MKPVSYYLSYSVRKLWLLTAVLLVMVATLMTVLRYSLPYMDKQKDTIESVLLERFGVDLDIGTITASWKGVGPAIVLEDVVLNSGDNAPVQLAIDKTEIEVNFWSSVLSRNLSASHFNLIGIDAVVNVDMIKRTESETPVVEVLERLFLEQLQLFSITDSSVKIKKGQDEQSIILQQLFWRNEGERHQGVGVMRVLELASNSASFTLNLTGNADNLEGVFFARGRELDISPWLKNYLHEEKTLQESRANFVLWANIGESELTSTRVTIEPSEFSWQDVNTGENYELLVKAGDLFAQPDLASRGSGEWQFELRDLTLQAQDEVDAKIGLVGQSAQDALTIELSDSFNLNPLLPVASAFLTESSYNQLEALDPNITLENVIANKSPEGWGARLSFRDLSINESGLIPGLERINGEVNWFDNQAHIYIDSNDSSFATNNLLSQPLNYDLFTIDAYVEFDSSNFDLYVPSISLIGDRLSFEQSLKYESSKNWLSISGTLGEMSTDIAKSLLPGSLMGTKTIDYLERSLVSGYVENGRIIWNGALDQFPYDEGQGIFQAGLTIDNIEFDFDSGWPNVVDANLDLLFENESLYISTPNARIDGVAATEVNAVIPKLHPDSHVRVKAKTAESSANITQLINHSTLADNLGTALQKLPIDELLKADVDLFIPLSGKDVIARGVVDFDNNRLEIEGTGIVLEQLTGQLTFENEKLNATSLKALYLGLPTQFNVQAEQLPEAYAVNTSLIGDWPIKELFKDQPEVAEYLDGIADWTGDLSLRFPEGDFSYELQLQSELEQISSDFPFPLDKEKESAKRLLVSSEGDLVASNVNMTLGDDIKFNGILPHKELVFSRAHLAIGNDNFVGMGIGFSVSVDVPTLDFMPWFDALNHVLQPANEPKKRYIDAPKRIFLKTDKLNIAGFPMHQIEVNVRNTELSWNALINADETRAEIDFFHQWQSKGIDAKADYFFLTETPSEIVSEGVSQVGKQLPPISFDCGQCRILGYDFGKALIKLAPTSSGMHISQLQVDTKHASLKADGDWFVSEENNSTRLKGNFVSKDFGDFLKEFDRDSGVRDSGAKMDFDLSWTAEPYAFELASLNGSVDWKLDDGNLTQVSDKGARIFSLLSLDSLVRKLSLDFRDVFAKGFFYNEMEGSFNVNNGVVYTDDTEIDGAAADITLVGSTDLNTQKLDYDVSIQPELTSSLPAIVGWLAFDPVSAAVAFAVDRAVKSAKVVSDIKYKLSGSISEPELTEIERNNKDIVLPAKVMPSEDEINPATDHLLIEKGSG
ncbi:TIGR02099 family protein [Alteromonadaceae bacterium M269]|nr:TIGR02099 family protein [Alteromonadaceae bacterium M269]